MREHTDRPEQIKKREGSNNLQNGEATESRRERTKKGRMGGAKRTMENWGSVCKWWVGGMRYRRGVVVYLWAWGQVFFVFHRI